MTNVLIVVMIKKRCSTALILWLLVATKVIKSSRKAQWFMNQEREENNMIDEQILIHMILEIVKDDDRLSRMLKGNVVIHYLREQYKGEEDNLCLKQKESTT